MARLALTRIAIDRANVRLPTEGDRWFSRFYVPEYARKDHISVLEVII